jgi:CDP-4-dehydro-6-deoxyglucose reductase
MRFWPGQYISLGSKDLNIPYKSYSIANIPNHEGEIILYVTKSQTGTTSKWIHEELKVGDKIKVKGPYGTFIGDPRSELPVICLANGSGLAPIMSLASAALLRGGFRYPATVLFSAKKSSDVFDLGYFSFLESKFRNFRFIPTLTQEENDKYKQGRITKLLPQMFPELEYYSLYIAGSVEFVEDCKKLALNLGAKEENIHIEGFYQQTGKEV